MLLEPRVALQSLHRIHLHWLGRQMGPELECYQTLHRTRSKPQLARQMVLALLQTQLVQQVWNRTLELPEQHQTQVQQVLLQKQELLELESTQKLELPE